MNTRDMMAIFQAELESLHVVSNGQRDPRLPVPLDWYALFQRETTAEWLVSEVWPVGRQVHMHAARKTGKSLIALWMACNLAIGKDAFTGKPIRPVVVGYLDYEMSEDDLLERVEEYGFTPDQLSGRLCYYLHPAIPMLDTADGGSLLVETLSTDGVEALVIDTMSRVVQGDENSNDTYIRFYKHTGTLLRAAGIAMLRLDHEGHEKGRSRGASSKADDVDIVWQLREMDAGSMQLVRKAARMSWIPENVTVRKVTEPSLRFETASDSWPAGTLEKANELDACDVPLDASRRKAAEMLKAQGYTAGKTIVLHAAMRYRHGRILGV